MKTNSRRHVRGCWTAWFLVIGGLFAEGMASAKDAAADRVITVGGTGTTLLRAVATDSAGNTYVAGNTTATDFPVLRALQSQLKGGGIDGDAVVLKYDAQGNLVFATYLGGGGDDSARGVVVQASGRVIVVGNTSSRDFPVVGGFQSKLAGIQDVFVAGLSADGAALEFSTLLGGGASDYAEAVGVDGAGNIYVGGWTQSDNFPRLNSLGTKLGGFADAFVAKLAPAGDKLVYSTLVGGGDFDFAGGLAVRPGGQVILVGQTLSRDFPTKNAFRARYQGGSSDGFVVELTPGGESVVFGTYLGGDGGDAVRAVAVDRVGAVYVTGSTQSGTFPTRDALQPARRGFANAFVTKFEPTGGGVVFSTYLGGGGTDDGNGIAVDAEGYVHVTGAADSPDFPGTDGRRNPGGGGFFVTQDRSTTWTARNAGFTGATVLAVVPDALIPSKVWVAGYGGVLASTDAGVTWQALNLGAANTYALALAQDRRNPAVLYASVQGSVLRTGDGGATWKPVNHGLPGAFEEAAFVRALAVDPAGSGTVYAGTDGSGAFRSKDGGANWERIPGTTSMSSVFAIVFDPADARVIYLGGGPSFGSSGFCLRSVDGGVTWVEGGTGLGSRVLSLAVDPSTPGTLYAGCSLLFGTGTGIARSTDGGRSWSAVLRSNFSFPSVAVDPRDSKALYAGADARTGWGLIRSTDGGGHWERAGLPNQRVTALALDPGTPGRIYAGTDGGPDIFVSVLKPDGAALAYSGRLGGTGTDFGQAIALGPGGTVHLAGYTHSKDLTVGPRATGGVAGSRALAGGVTVELVRAQDLAFGVIVQATSYLASTVTPPPVADLEINLGTVPGAERDFCQGASRPYVYLLQVRNRGKGASEQVAVTCVLPAKLGFLSSAPPRDSTGTQPLRFSLGSLGPGAETVIAIEVRGETPRLPVSVTAVVTGTNDPDTSNNEDTLELGDLTGLVVTQEITPAEYVPGASVIQTVRVTNQGFEPAIMPYLAVAFTPDASYSDSSDPSGRFTSFSETGTLKDTVTFGSPADIPVGGTKVYKLIFRPTAATDLIFNVSAGCCNCEAINPVEPLIRQARLGLAAPSVDRSQGKLMLRWSDDPGLIGNAKIYLETTGALVAEPWKRLEATPVREGGFNKVELDGLSGGARYYRLVRVGL